MKIDLPKIGRGLLMVADEALAVGAALYPAAPAGAGTALVDYFAPTAAALGFVQAVAGVNEFVGSGGIREAPGEAMKGLGDTVSGIGLMLAAGGLGLPAVFAVGVGVALNLTSMYLESRAKPEALKVAGGDKLPAGKPEPTG